MPSNIETSEKVSLLLKLTENLNLEGIERSFKMAEKKLLANRFLLGISKDEIEKEKLLDICQQMDMPKNYLDAFRENLSDANIVLLGFEESKETCVYKVYLEFWEKVKKEIHTKQNKKEPVLLYLGFKWDTRDNTKRVVSKYTCHPLLSVRNILKKISNIYDGRKDRTSFEIVEDIINLASSRLANAAFIYLEVGEENYPRKSFDINLYKANLQLKELYPLLSKIRRHYSIPSEKFDFLYNRINTKLLGHLSGGIDREGKNYLTIYYEVEGH